MYDTFQEQEVTLAINTFKGLDLKTPDVSKPPGVASICQNWRFDENGNLNRRKLYAEYNATSLGTSPITFLDRIYIGSNKYLIAAYGMSALVGDDSAGTFSYLKKALTIGQHYTGTTFKNFYYFGNGIDNNIKTDGTLANTIDMGCLPMAIAPSGIASAAAGLDPNTTYKYQHTWEYDGYQQANASGNRSVALSGTASATCLFNFETAPTLATYMRLYRTEGNGSIYYYHSRLTAGQVSSHPLSANGLFDVTPDSGLDTTITAPTDNGIPPKGKYLKLCKDRIFIAGNSTHPNYVYFTDITSIVSYPDIVPANNYFPIAEDDGDDIMGLAVDPIGHLCIFKKNHIYKLFTDGDPTLWTVSEPFAQDGCWADQTLKETPAGIIYLSKDGWRIFDGQNSKYISNDDRINKIIRNEISLERFSKCVGHYQDNLCYLAYTDRATSTTYNDRLLIYDTISNNFILEPKNIDSFTNFDGGDDWNELYWGDSNAGKTYTEGITIGGVKYGKLSDFRPNGTLSSMFAWNTETEPYLETNGHYTFARMNGSAFSDYPSGAAPSAWRDFPSAYGVSGCYFSPPILCNAKKFLYAYWHETLGDYGDATVAFRTSSTSAGLSGAWSSEFSDPTGSDIQSLSANDWVDFRLTLSSFGPSARYQATSPRMYGKDDYLFKYTYRVTGGPIETEVDAEWQSGYSQLTPELSPSRLRKFVIEHEGTEGNLSCMWDMDNQNVSGCFTVNLENYPKTYVSPFPLTAFGKRLRLRLKYDDVADLIIRSINILMSPQPETYK